jgi:hypothetical protein
VLALFMFPSIFRRAGTMFGFLNVVDSGGHTVVSRFLFLEAFAPAIEFPAFSEIVLPAPTPFPRNLTAMRLAFFILAYCFHKFR